MTDVPLRYAPPEGDELERAQELAKRDGRLTVEEAGRLLFEAGEGLGEFLLTQAIKNGEIKSYAPGSSVPLKAWTGGQFILGRPSNHELTILSEEELYSGDLNACPQEYPRAPERTCRR